MGLKSPRRRTLLGKVRLVGAHPAFFMFPILCAPGTLIRNFKEVARKVRQWRHYRLHLPRRIGARNLGGRAGGYRIVCTLVVSQARQDPLLADPGYSR